jgi:hypothetical protein
MEERENVMSLNRSRIHVAAFSGALALMLLIAPVSAEEKDHNRPVKITFAKWITGLTTAPVFGFLPESEPRLLMAGRTGGSVPDGTYVGEVFQRKVSVNPALMAGITKLEAIYEVHDASGNHVLTALIRGGSNAAGAAILDGVVLAGRRTGAPVHVEFETTVGCEGAPTATTTCFEGTIHVGRVPKGDD